MAFYNKLVLTNIGESTLTEVLSSGRNLLLSELRLSADVYNQTEIKNLVSLSNTANIIATSSVILEEETGSFIISGSFSNKDITEPLTINSIGLYSSLDNITKLIGVATAIEPIIIKPFQNTVNFYNLKLSLALKQSEYNAIKIINGNYLDISDLASYVKKSEMTVEIAKLTALLAQKATKGEVSVNDINKNLGKFDQTYMTDEFLQQIAGTTPVNATPADYSITTNKLASKGTTREKLADSFLANFPFLDNTNDLNTALKDGTYIAINAQNAPITGTLYVEVKGYGTLSPTSRWIEQIAKNPSFETYIRRIDINSGIFPEWTKVHVSNDGEDIKDLSIPESKIKNSAITADKLASKVITRGKLADSYLANFPSLDSTKDLNTALKDGTYVATDAQNAPITGTLFVDVKGFGTLSPTSRWIQQIARNFSFKTFIRIIDVNSGAFPQWTELSVLNNTNTSTPLAGKKIAFFGDSITDYGDYPNRVGTITGATVYNCGFGGTKMALIDSGNYNYFSMVSLSEAIKTNDYSAQDTARDAIYTADGVNFSRGLNILKGIDFSTLDYMVIFLGTNDYGTNGALIGENEDMVGTTFKGAINLTIKNILETYPQIKIYFITPTFRARFDVVGDGKDSDTTSNLDGLYLMDFVDAIKEVANLNHLPALDLYRESGVNKYNHATYLRDGLHPIANIGYQHIANKVSGFLISKY